LPRRSRHLNGLVEEQFSSGTQGSQKSLDISKSLRPVRLHRGREDSHQWVTGSPCRNGLDGFRWQPLRRGQFPRGNLIQQLTQRTDVGGSVGMGSPRQPLRSREQPGLAIVFEPVIAWCDGIAGKNRRSATASEQKDRTISRDPNSPRPNATMEQGCPMHGHQGSSHHLADRQGGLVSPRFGPIKPLGQRLTIGQPRENQPTTQVLRSAGGPIEFHPSEWLQAIGLDGHMRQQPIRVDVIPCLARVAAGTNECQPIGRQMAGAIPSPQRDSLDPLEELVIALDQLFSATGQDLLGLKARQDTLFDQQLGDHERVVRISSRRLGGRSGPSRPGLRLPGIDHAQTDQPEPEILNGKGHPVIPPPTRDDRVARQTTPSSLPPRSPTVGSGQDSGLSGHRLGQGKQR